MTSRAPYQLIATSILFLLFMANIPPAIAKSNKNTLPNEIFQGYWATIEPMQEMFFVINFKKDKKGNLTSERYVFNCGKLENFQTAQPFVDTITPTKQGLLLKAEGKYDQAIISVESLQPKHSLVLEHQLPNLPLQISIQYRYTATPTPICQL